MNLRGRRGGGDRAVDARDHPPRSRSRRHAWTSCRISVSRCARTATSPAPRVVLEEGVAEARTLGDERTELRIEIERWRVDSLLDGSDVDGAARDGAPGDRPVRAARRPRRPVGGVVPAGALRDGLGRTRRRLRASARSRDGGRRRPTDGGHLERVRRRHAVRADALSRRSSRSSRRRWPGPGTRAIPGVEADAALVGPYCYPLFGRWDEARALLERSKSLAVGARHPLRAGRGVLGRGADGDAGRRPRRRPSERCARALAIHEEIGATRYAAMVRAHLAHVLLGQDRVDDAGRHGRLGARPRRGHRAALRCVLADGAREGPGAHSGRRRRGRPTRPRGGRDRRRTDRLNLHAEALAMLADVLEASGDRAAAIAALEDARGSTSARATRSSRSARARHRRDSRRASSGAVTVTRGLDLPAGPG